MSDSQIDKLLDNALDGWRRGERPDIETLCAAHPEHAEEIRQLLSSMLLMEGVKHNSQSQAEWNAPGDTPDHLGDYRIIGEIGRGGMGVVYQAEQTSLGRRVALKILPNQISRDPTALRRFEREARAAARLHHTNIVPVFEIGSSDGANFYTMQLIQGASLDGVLEYLKQLRSKTTIESLEPTAASSKRVLESFSAELKERIAASLISGRFHAKNFADSSESRSILSKDCESSDPAIFTRVAGSASTGSGNHVDALSRERLSNSYWRSVARIGVQVAEALAYSHSHGIVHRDIKPGNLILDESGVVWVTDFGLALTADSDMTQTGDVLGTIRYMSPERFEGICAERSDIYSLGVTLYELLTLRPAFESSNRLQLIELIRNSQVASPSKSDSGIPRDLETIILKACEKDPENRYDSAGEMADDLQRFLDDEPIQARQVSSLERVMRWSRRNVGLAASLAAVLVLLLVLATASVLVASYFRVQQNAQQRLAFQKEQEADRAIASERASQIALYQAQMRMAGNMLGGASGTDQVVELTDRWYPEVAGRDLRGWEWYYLRSLCRRERLSIDTGQFMLWSVAWSPDGSKLITTGRRGTVKIWDCDNGDPLHSMELPAGQVTSVCWNPDGKRFVLAADRDLLICDVDTKSVVKELRDAHQRLINQVAWSPDGSRLASVGSDRHVRIWDVSSGEPMIEKRFPDDVQCVAWTPDSKLLACSGPFQAIHVIHAETGDARATLLRHTSTVRSVAWDPNGDRLVSGGQDRTVKLWDITKNSLHRYSVFRPSRVESVAWDPTGNLLAATQWDGAVLIIDVDARRKIHHLYGHEDRAWDVAWSPDGTQIASVALNGELKIWELSVAHESRALIGGEHGYEHVAWSADGNRLAASTKENIFVWDSLETDPRPLAQVDRVLTSLCWSPNGRQLASATGADSTKIWDATTGDVRWELNPGSRSDYAVAWSPDGRLIASVNDRALTLHDVEAKDVFRVLATEPGKVLSIDWNADSRTLATAHVDGTISLWAAESGQLLGQLTGHSDAVTSVRWNDAGTQLASTSRDRTVRVWDAASQRTTQMLRGHTRKVNSVCWHPGGTRLATASEDESVRIWDLTTGNETLAMGQHSSNVTSVDWNVDGMRIVSGSWDSTVRVWDATRGHEMAAEKMKTE